MKKLLMAAAAVAFLAPAAFATEQCDKGGTPVWCKWNSGCEKVSDEYDDTGTKCPVAAQGNCKSCEWNVTNCENYGMGLYSDATCTTMIGGQDCSSFGSCDWGDGCYPISPNPNDANNPSTTCEQAYSVCQQFGTPVSSCPGGGGGGGGTGGGTGGGSDPYTPPSPTIALPTSVGLTVLANGNTLQILSSGAKVSLFDMNGTLVQSGAVSKGNSVFAISQKQGIYYAVVKAGSATQTVKVVVK